MFCQGCGKELADGIQFCPNCGRQVGATVQEPKQNLAQQQTNSGLKNKLTGLLGNKRIVYAGLAVIVVLLILLIIPGKQNSNDAGDKSRSSVGSFEEIHGSWKCVSHYSGGADPYDAFFYYSDYDLDISKKGILATACYGTDVVYSVSAKDVMVEKKDGIKYYSWNAKLDKKKKELWNYDDPSIVETVPGGEFVIGIRVYVDKNNDRLVLEYNAPEDGLWLKICEYEIAG